MNEAGTDRHTPEYDQTIVKLGHIYLSISATRKLMTLISDLFRVEHHAPSDLVIRLDEGDFPPGGASDPFAKVVVGEGSYSFRRYDLEGVLDSREARIRLEATRWAVESALRITSSLVLPVQGALLIHGASLVRGGRGFLLAGASEAGKTTALLSTPADIRLTDEISILTREAGGFRLHSSPFWGRDREGFDPQKMVDPEGYPLELVALLRHGGRAAARRLGPHDALAPLLECVVCYTDHPPVLRSNLDLTAELVESTACHVVELARGDSLWRAL